jgi:hypothetical protein
VSQGRERDGPACEWPRRAPPPLPSHRCALPPLAAPEEQLPVPRAGPCSRVAAVAAASFLEATCAFPRLAAEGGREGPDPLLRLMVGGVLKARGKQPSAPHARGMGTRGKRLMGRNPFAVPICPLSLPQSAVCAFRDEETPGDNLKDAAGAGESLRVRLLGRTTFGLGSRVAPVRVCWAGRPLQPGSRGAKAARESAPRETLGGGGRFTWCRPAWALLGGRGGKGGSHGGLAPFFCSIGLPLCSCRIKASLRRSTRPPIHSPPSIRFRTRIDPSSPRILDRELEATARLVVVRVLRQ